MALTPQENLTDVEPTAEKPLFTQEQLAEHARSLAVEHEAVIRPGPNALLHRLDQNEHRLRAYNRDSYTVGRARQITPPGSTLSICRPPNGPSRPWKYQ